MGAWIETYSVINVLISYPVAPLWERGLKQEENRTYIWRRQSLPYGSVD